MNQGCISCPVVEEDQRHRDAVLIEHRDKCIILADDAAVEIILLSFIGIRIIPVRAERPDRKIVGNLFYPEFLEVIRIARKCGLKKESLFAGVESSSRFRFHRSGPGHHRRKNNGRSKQRSCNLLSKAS